MTRSIVWRCALTVVLAQVVQVIVLVTVAYNTGARPLFNAWAERASATMQRHHRLMSDIAGTRGLSAATDAAATLSAAEIEHRIVRLADMNWQANYLDMPGDRWRTLAENEDGPVSSDGKLRSITVVPQSPRSDTEGLVILSTAEWPLWHTVGTRPTGFAIWAVGGLLFSAVAGGLVAVWFTGPIVRLRRSVASFAAGQLDARPSIALQSRDDEIGAFARELTAMQGRIAALVTAQRGLLDDVAHELRSPLTRLNIAVELADQARTNQPGSHNTDRSEELFRRIRNECGQLASMVNRLLELSALEHHLEDDRRAEVGLGGLITMIVDDCDFEAQATDRRVNLRTLQDCSVLGSEDMLRSAIENVVRNAIRYTPAGRSVDITLRTATPGHDRAIVTIRDHGPGVPDDVLPKLFQPFYRVEIDRSKDSGGIGLGLALAHRAIRAHAGTILARKHADGGLEVTIELPAAAP